MKNLKNLIQPLCFDKFGVLRFKENKIISFMLEAGERGEKFDMNSLGTMDFSDEDREQLAQLIGCSVSDFGDLNYVSNETWKRANEQKPRSKT